MNTETTILAIIIIIALVGVCIHAFLEMGRDTDYDDKEIDLTPFGKNRL